MSSIINKNIKISNSGQISGDTSLTLAVNDSSKVSILSSGNVGIGITNPSTLLHVNGASTLSGNVGIGTYDLTVNTDTLKVDSGNSRVGIGTATPAYKLDVTGDINFTGNLKNNGTNVSFGGSSQWTTVNTNEIYYNSGNVGIGTNDPSSTLHVIGTSTLSGNVNIGAYDLTVNTNTLKVDSGNSWVGIGTATPSYKLDVNGSALLRNGNGGSSFTNSQLLFGYSGSNQYIHNIKSRHNNVADNSTNALDFYMWQTTDLSTDIGSKHVMTVSSTGVGIGTTNPNNTLDVIGDEYISGSLTIQGVLGVNSTGTFTSNLNVNGNFTVNSTRLKVLSTGNVGIGTTNPAHKLDVQTDVFTASSISIKSGWTNQNSTIFLGTPETGQASKCAIIAEGLSSNGRNKLNFCLNSSATDSTAVTLSDSRMVVTYDGNVGIGTTTPSDKLHIYKNSSSTQNDIIYLQDNNITLRLGTTSGSFNGFSGALSIHNSGNWICGVNTGGVANISDRNYKNNIEYFENTHLSKILLLKPASFTYKNSPVTKKTIGIIAQDLLEIYPDIIDINYDDISNQNIHTLNYNSVAVLAIQAIKELNEKIILLENRILNAGL